MARQLQGSESKALFTDSVIQSQQPEARAVVRNTSSTNNSSGGSGAVHQHQHQHHHHHHTDLDGDAVGNSLRFSLSMGNLARSKSGTVEGDDIHKAGTADTSSSGGGGMLGSPAGNKSATFKFVM